MHDSKKILVTGTAGFIGFHVANALLAAGHTVLGLDNINDYYDVQLKLDRLAEAGIEVTEAGDKQFLKSSRFDRYTFVKADLQDRHFIADLFNQEKFDVVINLAAQAGVRYSIENPYTYIDSNITGFLNILEGCRHTKVSNLIYASSSSVYGLNKKMPFSTSDGADHPMAMYAVSKKSNELMAHSYSHLFDIPTTGLRFFTVYGPWGRPDMALFLFAKAITENRPIDVYNKGLMSRDFTYVSDIVESIVRLVDKPASPASDWNPADPDPSISSAPYRIFNIGKSAPSSLLEFIECIEKCFGKEAQKNMLPLQQGDVPATWANADDLYDFIGFKPSVGIDEGVKAFVQWYRSYYQV